MSESWGHHFLDPNKLGLGFIASGLALFLFLFVVGDYETLDITIIPVISGILMILINTVVKVPKK